MVSERKREANRKNAQKPRGPRKKNVGAGLAPPAFHPYQDFSTFSWDWELLAELKAGYAETLQPQNKLEESLVDMLCHASLRLQRVPYLEHEYHATHPKGFLFNEKENHFGPFYRAESKHFYTQLFRYEASAQRSFYKALETLLKLQDERISGRGGACSARSTGQNPYPLVPKRSTPGTGGACPAPTGEPIALHTPPHRCHPDRREGSPELLRSRLNVSETGCSPEEIPPCGRDDTDFWGNSTPKPPQKTHQISHQIPPAKTPKTPAPPANSPQGNRWLTQTLATVSQKIKALTQQLKLNLHQALASALGWEAFFEGQPEGPCLATLRNQPSFLPTGWRGGEPGSEASPLKKASHPRARPPKGQITTGPDPPESS